MESEATEKQSSYRYWVRESREDAAPPPVPRKLSAEDISSQSQPSALGSVWNQAGTWEEKNLNSWASNRIKELLTSVGCLEFSSGKADIAEVSKCAGDAFLVTVRHKKRVGYTYELTLKIKGEWSVNEERKNIKAHIDVLEFSYGELDDLQIQVQPITLQMMQIQVRLSEEKDLAKEEKQQICKDLRLFLTPIREKLLQFEQELKDR
ncbi:chaperone binding / ATPase activator isoform X1 [Tasmannia lanceolata]|uniref:chaperone binding / ATPase activator isoform X1 n=1 Tax=Tasmannia lanceolata TaxID=3420 RepID=UPI004063D581